MFISLVNFFPNISQCFRHFHTKNGFTLTLKSARICAKIDKRKNLYE